MKCRKWMAITLAAMMAMGTMTMAYAEDEPENGNTTTTYGSQYVTEGVSKTVEGNVIGDSSVAAEARQGSTLIINGSVINDGTQGSYTTSNSCGVLAATEGTIQVSGDVAAAGEAVDAKYSGVVTVEGSVSSKNNYSVYANNSTVTVGGDATTGDKSVAVYARKESEVTVGGNVTNGTGIAVCAENSTVTVGGDAVAKGEEDSAAVDATDSNVTIGGDATSSNDDAVDITVSGTQDGPCTVIVAGDITSGDDSNDIVLTVNTTLDEDTELSDLVEIAVGSLDPDKVSATDSEGNDLTAELLESIQYIVTTDEESAAINYTGTDLFHGYDTALAGYEITVSSDKDGYKIKSLEAGQYAEVSKNKDGTWTVLVKNGGDLVLCATLVKNSDGTVTVVETTTTKAKTTTAPKYAKGSKVYINGGAWIITDIDDEGIWTLRSLKAFKEAELTDREAVLESMLTEAQLADVLTNEAGEHVQEIDSDGHIIIRCENGIMTAKL